MDDVISPLLQTNPERSNVCNEIDDECRLERTAAIRMLLHETTTTTRSTLTRDLPALPRLLVFRWGLIACRGEGERDWEELLISSVSVKDEVLFSTFIGQNSIKCRQKLERKSHQCACHLAEQLKSRSR